MRPREDCVRLAAGGALVAMLLSACAPAPEVKRDAHRGALRQIVYVNPLPHDPVWDTLGTCMTAEAKRFGIAVETRSAPGGNVDIPGMEELVAQAVATHAQAIAAWPGAPAAFDILFEKAQAQGAVVASLGEGTTHHDFVVPGSSGGKMRALVRAAARRPGHHTVGVILGVKDGATDAQDELRAEMRKHKNLMLADVGYNGGKFTEDIALTKAMLAGHPDIDIMLNYSGFPGMYTALREEAGHHRVIAFSPGNFHDAMLGYIDDGFVGGVYVRSRCTDARAIVTGLRAAWAGRRFTPVDTGRVVSPAAFRRLPKGWM